MADIRLVRPDDAAGLAALYDRLSSDDRRLRFFSQHRVTAEDLTAWTADDATRFGLVAVDPDAGIVGHALAVVDAAGDGEFALTVDRTFRGGLGSRLFDALLAEAARRSVRNLVGEILEENGAMFGVVRRHGLAVTDRPERGVVRLAIGAGTPTPAWSGDGRRPRLLVEAKSWRWHWEQAVRDAGVDVAICPGPRPGVPCPALAGDDCPLVDGCDAVVVVVREDDPVGRALAAWHADRDAVRALPFAVDSPTGELPDDLPPGAVHLLAAGGPDAAVAWVTRLLEQG